MTCTEFTFSSKCNEKPLKNIGRKLSQIWFSFMKDLLWLLWGEWTGRRQKWNQRARLRGHCSFLGNRWWLGLQRWNGDRELFVFKSYYGSDIYWDRNNKTLALPSSFPLPKSGSSSQYMTQPQPRMFKPKTGDPDIMSLTSSLMPNPQANLFVSTILPKSLSNPSSSLQFQWSL